MHCGNDKRGANAVTEGGGKVFSIGLIYVEDMLTSRRSFPMFYFVLRRSQSVLAFFTFPRCEPASLKMRLSPIYRFTP